MAHRIQVGTVRHREIVQTRRARHRARWNGSLATGGAIVGMLAMVFWLVRSERSSSSRAPAYWTAGLTWVSSAIAVSEARRVNALDRRLRRLMDESPPSG